MNIKDLEFSPNCPDEVLTQAKNWLKDKNKNFIRLANFCFFSNDGVSHAIVGADCHGAVNRPNISDRCCTASEIGIQRQIRDGVAPVTVELYEPFLKWLLYDSFFGRFILNRNDYEFCRDYGIVVSADIPCALMQNILIISRSFIEYHPKAFEAFNHLTSEGYPGSVAFSVAFNSNIGYWKRVGDMASAPPEQEEDKFHFFPRDTHVAWPLWRNMASFNNFMEGDFGSTLTNDPSRHFRKIGTIFGGFDYCVDINAIYYSTFVEDAIKNSNALREELKDYRQQTVSTVKEVVNPFSRPSAPLIRETPYTVTLKELFGVILPNMKLNGAFKNACC